MNVIKQENVAKVAVNKSLLKEYTKDGERIVYLDNGTEFQIQVFNPYPYVIGLSFEFNDNIDLSYQLLVVRPGERIWLDRYLNKEAKLLFSTYEVGNSKAIQEAIKNNGKLCIKLYKEKQYNYYNNLIYTYPNNYATYYNNFNDNIKLYNCSCDTDKSLDLDATYEVKNYCDANYSLNLNAVNSSVTCGSSATTFSTSTSATPISKSLNKTRSKSVETGRIEEGSHSNQKFQNVYKDFESWPFRTEIIKLLPKSQKPIYKNDLTKLYCINCGRKINTKFKYCPYCGTKTI